MTRAIPLERSFAARYPLIAEQAHGWDPSSVASMSATKYTWRCPKSACGHVWLASPAKRAGGRGCPACAGRAIVAGLNDLATHYPAVAEEAHGWDPSTVAAKSSFKLAWKCRSCEHVWQTPVRNRTFKGSGCPACSGRKPITGRTDLATLFPAVAAEADGWNAVGAPARSSGRRQWRCSACDFVWGTAIANRTVLGNGCPACAGQRVRPGVNSLAVVNPSLASEAYGWDPDLYLPNSNHRAQWRCSACSHIWAIQISARNGLRSGCPACSGRIALPGIRSLSVAAPDLAAEAQGWDPDTVPPQSHSRRLWECRACSWQWVAPVNGRMNGRGCPSCARSGFDPAKPGVVYLLQKRDTRGRLILKVGISNVPRQRHAILAKDGWTVRDVSPMIHGQAARDLEQMVLAHLDSRGIPRGSRAFPVPFDGYTESWHAQAFRPRTVPDLVRVVGGHLPEVEAEAA